MRCFLAVDLDETLRDAVAGLQEEIRSLDVKLVERENLHFTLKFFGEIGGKTIEKASKETGSVSSQFDRFEINIEGTGAFPGLNYIRVVWLGAKGLSQLQEAVQSAFGDIPGEGASIPHLTIARVRSTKDMEEIRAFVKKHALTRIGKMAVEEIKLKKSVITGKGHVYGDVETFKLGV